MTPRAVSTDATARELAEKFVCAYGTMLVLALAFAEELGDVFVLTRMGVGQEAVVDLGALEGAWYWTLMRS